MTFSTYQKAAGLMVVGVLSMSVMDVMAKTVGTHVPVGQVVWLRFVTQAVLIGGFLMATKQKPFESSHLKLHALRGLATALSSFLFFLGIIHLPLADATALIQLGPVAVTVGAVLFLGEKIGRRRLAGILVAFLGAMFIIRPDTSIMRFGFSLSNFWNTWVCILRARYKICTYGWTMGFSILARFFWSNILFLVCSIPLEANSSSTVAGSQHTSFSGHHRTFIYDKSFLVGTCQYNCTVRICRAFVCNTIWRNYIQRSSRSNDYARSNDDCQCRVICLVS